jgi:hypothetical protein
MYYSKKLINYILTFLIISSCTNKEIHFHRQIKPIIHKNCATCHNPNGAGPFNLISYEDIKKRTDMISEVINQNYMPPWPADPEYRSFTGEKSLTKEEKDIIKKWIKNGAIEGDITEDLFLNFNNKKSKPDLQITMDTAHSTSGLNNDEFWMMKFPLKLENDTFIKRIEFVPDNKQVVHHMNAHLISYKDKQKKDILKGERKINTELYTDSEAFQKLDILNDDGTYPILTPSVSNYLPGSESIQYPEGIGILQASKKNIILVNDFHYAPTPYAEKDSSYFNIYFSSTPPKRIVKETQLGTFGISKIKPALIIPPNKIKKFRTQARITQDISLLTINPHMHLLGKSFLSYAVTLNNDTIPLIKIDNWNFRWQYFYTFKKMLKIPAGSEIIVEATFDNTINNPDNPFSPPQQISERKDFNGRGSMKTSDEMLQFIINYLDYQEGDENIILGP